MSWAKYHYLFYFKKKLPIYVIFLSFLSPCSAKMLTAENKVFTLQKHAKDYRTIHERVCVCLHDIICVIVLVFDISLV